MAVGRRSAAIARRGVLGFSDRSRLDRDIHLMTSGVGVATLSLRAARSEERHGGHRHEASVAAISWIPSEAIEGLSKVPFELDELVQTHRREEVTA